MKEKKWIKCVLSLVIMLSSGFLFNGCFKDEYAEKTYSSYTQYNMVRAIDIANGKFEPGTPVYFMARVNFDGYSRDLTALTDSSGSLYGNKVDCERFGNALAECNGTIYVDTEIYGVINESKKLKILRVVKNDGRYWTL